MPARQGASRAKLSSANASPYAGAINAALSAVPRAVQPKDFGALEALGANSWRLCAPHENGPPRDLFVEAPEGWWVGRACAARRRRGLLQADNRRQAEGRRPSRRPAPEPHRRRGGGGDDGRGQAEGLGAGWGNSGNPAALYGPGAPRLVSGPRPPPVATFLQPRTAP